MTACLHQSKFEMSLLLYPETMLSFLWSDIHKPYQSLLITAITDIIKWCHGCGFPCEKMSEEQVLKFHTLMTCHYPDLGNCTSSVWNFCGCSSDGVLQGNLQQRHRLMLAVFSGYNYCGCRNDASFKPYLLLLLWSQVYYQSESQMLWSYSVSRNKLSHSTNFHSLCVKTAQLHLIFYKVDFFGCKMIVPVSFIH